MGYKLAPIAPLNGLFMITAILGFLISTIFIYDLRDHTGAIYPWAPSIGFSFSLVFVLMFVASLISMTYADVEEELQIDETRKIKRI